MHQNNKLFYTYKDENLTGKVPLEHLSSYFDSLIFDEENRRIWFNTYQFGNTYWGTKHGETFNDLDNNNAGDYAHAEGTLTNASGNSSHAEGHLSKATGNYAHAEGNDTIASGDFSHAQGSTTEASGQGAHAEGNDALASGNYSHAQGNGSKSEGTYSDAQGLNTISLGEGAHSEGCQSEANAKASHAEGYNTITSEEYSHAEGYGNEANGKFSHVEGMSSLTSSAYSHAEGSNTTAGGEYSHTEGHATYTGADGSHAEGIGSAAYASYSHVEGDYTLAYGRSGHAEGNHTIAYGEFAHAEGNFSVAYGKASHAEGNYNVTYNLYETAFGEFNKSIHNADDLEHDTVFTIGDGTDEDHRHNIIDFRKNGDMHKNGISYFHDDVYGPVSNTYVASLGEAAILDIVLHSSLEQPKYTKPQITVQFKSAVDGNLTSLTSNKVIYEDVEIGSYYIPAVQINWPTRTADNLNGSRAYDSIGTPVKPNELLGYSYGLVENGISLDCFGINYSAYVLDTLIEYPKRQVVNENELVLFDNIKVSYLQASYMYFNQLYDRNVYVNAYGDPSTAWFDKGVCIPETVKYVINGRYRYYWGITEKLPTTEAEVKSQYTGLLNSSKFVNGTVTSHLVGKDFMNKSFWVAYPAKFAIAPYNDYYKVCCEMHDGVTFDLVTDDQRMTTKKLTMSLGDQTVKENYNLSYFDFRWPIGVQNAIVSFRIVPGEEIDTTLI